MSMIGNLLRVSAVELEEFLKNSTLLEERVCLEEDTEDTFILDLDKSWEYIYYLLTGCSSGNYENASPPLSLILFNGKMVDEEQDMGYGPATYCTPEEVKKITNALPDFNLEMLRLKFATMQSSDIELYPFNPDNEKMYDYILYHYSKMKVFYEEAVSNGQAVISFIS